MISISTLHDLLSGKRRGIAASLFRGAAACVEQPVKWLVNRRNRAFDDGRARVEKVAATVISIGNLTVGGTGKTPLVEWLAKWLSQQGSFPVLISRGYGSRAGKVNDEALELALRLPHVPHLQNPNRVQAANEAVEKFPGSVLLLDDAFQHRRLHRDLDIVLLDALNPFGYEHLLPRGLLRESVENLSRAQIIILSRANLIDEQERLAILAKVSKLAPQAIWAEAIHAPVGLINSQGDTAAVDLVSGKKIAAFCGIGNPLGFRRTVESLGCEIIIWREFADHQSYGDREIASLAAERHEQAIDYWLCTRKDLVKIPAAEIANVPLWALEVGLRFTVGEHSVVEALRQLL